MGRSAAKGIRWRVPRLSQAAGGQAEPYVLAGPANAGEVAVAAPDGVPLGVAGLPVVGVAALLLGAVGAEAVGVEAAHRARQAVEAPAAAVAGSGGEEAVLHFRFLPGCGCVPGIGAVLSVTMPPQTV